MLEKATSHRVSRLIFGVYTSEEILKLSVKEITNPQTFDNLQHATSGGLYDRSLGPLERDDICVTCGLGMMACPGHMGHIVLPLTVYNPVFFRQLFLILKASCFHCKKLLVQSARSHFLLKSLELLSVGLIPAIQGLQEVYHAALAVNDDQLAEDGKAVELFNKEEVIKALDGYVQRVLNENVDAKREQQPAQSSGKHSSWLRHELVAEVLRCQFSPAATKQCQHCSMPSRSMRAEMHCKIFFNKGISYRAAEKARMNRKMGFAPMSTPREDDVEEDVIVEGEELNDYEDNASSGIKSGGRKHKSTEFSSDSDTVMQLTEQAYITPSQAKEHMRLLWKHEAFALRLVFGMLQASSQGKDSYPTDVFFLDVVPAPPTRFRPTMFLKGTQYENAQTASLRKVLMNCVTIRTILREMRDTESKGATTLSLLDDSKNTSKRSDRERLHSAWIMLQMSVNALYDSDLDRLSTEKNPGVKQILEKKEGLFRKHMMGKRVDFAARSVISPDPYISVDEIGIPMVFAKKLTYPEPVNPWNVAELRQAVLNGPDIYPGASHVEMDSGKKVLLSASDKTQREALAKSLLTQMASIDQLLIQPKRVHRHLKTGDVLLLNRQPTLHRPSIQAHRARVLPGEKTLRLHYACCKAYNADFDGDEMNAHFPQNELGRSEAYNIVSVRNQYLVPKDGTPLAGLIQDHMVSGAWLTIRGRFFSRYDYQQLVYSALTDHPSQVKLLRPSILKPKALWSGKQVLSTVLLNIIPKSKVPLNLNGKAKISSKTWTTSPCQTQVHPTDDLCESEVVIRQGELLCGVLDKNHYGATPYSLVHCCYELYGGETSTAVLTCFAKLFTAFLQYRGFSLGIEDILVTKKADRKRRHVIKAGRKSGPAVLASALDVQQSADGASDPAVEASTEALSRLYQAAQFASDEADLRGVDRAMKKTTDEIQNDITKACMPLGLLKKFPDNNLQLMVLSGAKGSTVNCMQISCLLGQMELEGRRPPLMLSGRSLPSFLPYDSSPRAGGFIDARFLTGLRPQEFFFHCMAGREGLVDTAVKTSRSGYLQRCIIKHLEGVTVSYDLTVRDSDSSIVQFQYGEDSLEVTKTQFLNQKQFPFLINNQDIVLRDDELKQITTRLDTSKADKMLKRVTRSMRKLSEASSKKDRVSPFLMFSKEWPNSEAAVQPVVDGYRSQDSHNMVAAYRDLDEVQLKQYLKYADRALPPVMSSLNPHKYFGSIPEKLANIISDYTAANPHGLIAATGEAATQTASISSERFRSLINLRCLRSLAEPGEAVGLLAAQSIGEPSTQMTLNTFHFAGRGDMNVTLGIPRLREVLMVASANIKTPTMEIPLLNPSSKRARRRAEAVQRRLCRVTFNEVIENVQIWESLDVSGGYCKRFRFFKIRFNFLPQAQYEERCVLTSQKVLRFFEKQFVIILREAIKKAIALAMASRLTHTAKVVMRKTQRSEDESRAGASVAPADEDEDSDEDVANNERHDDDAAATKARERHTEELDYVGEEAEKQELGMNVAGDEDEVGEEEDNAGDLGVAASVADGRDNTGVKKEQAGLSSKADASNKIDAGRVHAVTSLFPEVLKYEYDIKNEEWCEITFQFSIVGSKIDLSSVIQNEARKAIVYQSPGIKRSFLSDVNGGQTTLLRTDGVNVAEVYMHGDLLDLNRLYSNDVLAMLHSYGVEAAARVIVKECRDVFAAYGIDVDYRHLSLIADYMTYDGMYKPFNRIGIEANPSPLQKMSFETTMHFLKTATMEGAADDLNSPSSRLVTGRIVNGGTGCFDLLLNSEVV